MKTEKAITRRDFIKGAAGIVLTTAIGSSLPSAGEAETRSRVVVVRDANVLGPQGEINSNVLQSMLDEAVRALTNKKRCAGRLEDADKKIRYCGHKDKCLEAAPDPSRA